MSGDANSQKFARMFREAREMFEQKRWPEMNQKLVDVMIDMAFTPQIDNLRDVADAFEALGALLDKSDERVCRRWRDVAHSFFRLADRSGSRGLDEHETRRIARMLELHNANK